MVSGTAKSAVGAWGRMSFMPRDSGRGLDICQPLATNFLRFLVFGVHQPNKFFDLVQSLATIRQSHADGAFTD